MDEGDRRSRGRPRGWDDKSAQNTIKSLDRAMEVLTRLSEMEGATLSELANDLGQPPASVYRVLVTLEGRGIVHFETGSQVWHIGPTAFLIGARFLRRTSLVERARPVLRALMDATGETANLGVENVGRVLFVSQVETHASIRAFFPPGTMSPMHASGIGKALLAQKRPEEVAQIVKRHPLEGFTSFTLVTPKALAEDLRDIRERGYSFDREERTLGMRCIASPVFDATGEVVAGISVSGPAQRISDTEVPKLGGQVKAAAQSLTIEMGGH